MSSHPQPPADTTYTLQSFMGKVGVGKSGSKNLSREEARDAMRSLLAGRFHPVTFGAFFMALRYKGETSDELAGFLDAMYEAKNAALVTALGADTAAVPAGLLSCAGAYNGKSRTLNVGLAAGLIVAAAGVPVIFHGARGVPAKFGMTISHILEALGIKVRAHPAAVLESLHSAGIGYIDQAELNPAFHALLPFRVPMGKRTILNTMELLSNPFGARYHVGGFFHDPYATLMGEALTRDGMPFSRAALVKGIEGSDELRPGGVFYADVNNGRFELQQINSDELGLPIHISQLSARADSVADQVKLSLDALDTLMRNPLQDSPYRNAVLLNAGLRLAVAGKAADVSAGISRAKGYWRMPPTAKCWRNGRSCKIS
jgi:anthranilate phosphoribosyltransferase